MSDGPDVHAPTHRHHPHRQTPRRHTPARAPLFALVGLLGLLATACGTTEEPRAAAAGPESQEVHLQPVGTAGPDPFTNSSATAESAPVQPPLPNASGQGIRTVNAATPGLYGGTQRLGSCDVEQQVGFLTGDDAKAGAFARASGIEQARLPEYLRGLTPVVLRADARVTSHGLRDGREKSFQSVLQAGTAVLVDNHGMPRVRCACGNPLGAPRAPKGSPVLKGDAWNGYQANQVIVIEPTAQVLGRLTIVNIANNTWIERTSGDDGAQDRTPQAVPPYDPSDGIPNGPVTSAEPSPGESAPPGAPSDGPSGPPADVPDGLPPGVPSGQPQEVPSGPAAGVPSEVPPGVPPGQPSDIPPDPFTEPMPVDPGSPNGDPGLPTGPDAAPDQVDPYGPGTVPDVGQQPSDPGGQLESA
ncbi:DUF6777 domain-containing protein [Streptomyces sp. WM4235]|uniref:DUF6777 domain-containing protein n=1 Tax=Streptomyces sp. WM4235 TaxID=1415551 RepID=UPI0006AE2FA8|nr:DUF6777 domain-containing protein [Streptomyces sp. WM4235]